MKKVITRSEMLDKRIKDLHFERRIWRKIKARLRVLNVLKKYREKDLDFVN